MRELNADILVVGGGTGGCAAAMAATAMGRSVVMTEESDWLGGQLTAQAVPPDEHPWIETTGCTARYRSFRNGVRAYYRDHYPLSDEARAIEHLNPGNGYVSRLCHEPRVAVAVIEQMLAPARTAGRLRVLPRHRPIAAHTDGDNVLAVTVENLDDASPCTIAARYILDATELGDVLALAEVEYVSGAESQEDTGELHAVAGPAQPENVQAITWCFPAGYDSAPGADHTIDEPEQYATWRDHVPQLTPPWPGPLLSWRDVNPITVAQRDLWLFECEWSRWKYRRIVNAAYFKDGTIAHDVSLVNWPQIDYFGGNIIDKPEPEVREKLHNAMQLSLSWMHWMQTEAPNRTTGGRGYPGLYLVPELVGTTHGLAKAPYIRESRRIRAEFTVLEEHVGSEMRTGRKIPPGKGAALAGKYRAEPFHDSVGVGCYRIDLHMSTGGDNYIDVGSLPFQVPLGALIPRRVDNLLPAAKNIGTTHITNGCYRLHPVEWNIGEAAGALAAFCLQRDCQPRRVRANAGLLADFQAELGAQGVLIDWPNRHELYPV